MEIVFTYLKAILVGGAICAVGQILVDKTKLTPARILTSYVVAGAGATVPLLGFGSAIAEGVKKAVAERGALGIFTGAVTAAAAGLGAAVLFGLLAAAMFKPREK